MYNLSTLTFKFNNNNNISVKETLLKLDLESKGQGHSEKQNNMQGNKNIPPPNKLSRDSLGNCVQLMSRTGYE